jgi:hypothetical protein
MMTSQPRELDVGLDQQRADDEVDLAVGEALEHDLTSLVEQSATTRPVYREIGEAIRKTEMLLGQQRRRDQHRDLFAVGIATGGAHRDFRLAEAHAADEAVHRFADTRSLITASIAAARPFLESNPSAKAS